MVLWNAPRPSASERPEGERQKEAAVPPSGGPHALPPLPKVLQIRGSGVRMPADAATASQMEQLP